MTLDKIIRCGVPEQLAQVEACHGEKLNEEGSRKIE